jgi:hypothetical protein
MTDSTVAAKTWVVIYEPNRSPSPFAAFRYKDGQTYGYALDGINYDLVHKQLPPGGMRRGRAESDHPAIVEFWDYA